ncbi:hypothetical protein WJX73_001553 [Symbiochloris irregularis]|uniref:Uncharacterized protein n=1 Tax=Symbiochloris irregularis TaxID=706552 RepID=A0AAW1P1A9_9CHLO
MPTQDALVQGFGQCSRHSVPSSAHFSQACPLAGRRHSPQASLLHQQHRCNAPWYAHRQRRGPRLLCPQAAAVDQATAALQGLELCNVLNVQGLILPEVPDGTEATVFAIFDGNKKLQFVGFSKDLRNSLRTLMGRRPDRLHFYKAAHLQKLDQSAMVAMRAAWFEEVGGQPPGNKLANERKMWQQPVEAGAISDRGRLQAAETQVQEQLNQIRLRGCKEEFIPNPALLQQGQVDFLPTKAMTPEELQRQRDELEAMAKATRTITTVTDGQPSTIELFIKMAFQTRGGYMFDVTVTYEEKETQHRVIVGREYYEGMGIEPEAVLDRVFAFLIRKRVPRRTEGMMLSSQFPSNYFGVSDVEQWFDDFADEFADTGKVLPGPSKFWRFNKIYSYGDESSALDASCQDDFQFVEAPSTPA